MPTFHSWSDCHELCIIDNIVELMNRGYTCYPEYELAISEKMKAIVDIYAVKGDKAILVEVGTLSQLHGNRIELLKSLMPKAKIVHIHQWKNYFSVYDCDEEYIRSYVKEYAWKKDREMYALLSKNEIDVRLALDVAARGVKWSDANYEIGRSLGDSRT